MAQPQVVVNDYKIIICCFSAKHAALRRKSKDWLAHNQNNVSGWSNMSTRGLLFLELTQCVGLEQSGPQIMKILMEYSRHTY
jgi:hypothetical protein